MSKWSILLSCMIVSACAASRGDGIDVSTLPDQALRDDYSVFAQRCSKCHSLARPLGSGITDDEYWRRYVKRMKQMPSSGITSLDEPAILRFLHWYSEGERKKSTGQGT
jgi:predicted small secreted protein